MKIFSRILSADPNPVAFIVFLMSALCGGVILVGHPSADFVSDQSLTGSIALICGVLGNLFLDYQKPKPLKVLLFVVMMIFYYLTSASAINGHLYDSVIHLVFGLSSSWAFIHQNKLCVNK